MKVFYKLSLLCLLIITFGCGKSSRESNGDKSSHKLGPGTVRFEFTRENKLLFSGTETLSEKGPVIPYPFNNVDNLKLSLNLPELPNEVEISGLQAKLLFGSGKMMSNQELSSRNSTDKSIESYSVHPMILSKKSLTLSNTENLEEAKALESKELVLDFGKQLNIFTKSKNETSILEIMIPQAGSEKSKKIKIRFFKAPHQIIETFIVPKSSENIKFKNRSFRELATVKLENPYPYSINVNLPGAIKLFTEYEAKIYRTSSKQCSHTHNSSRRAFSSETDILIIFKGAEFEIFSDIDFNFEKIMGDLPSQMRKTTIEAYGSKSFAIFADLLKIKKEKIRILTQEKLSSPSKNLKVATSCHRQRVCKKWSRTGGRDGDHGCSKTEEEIASINYTQRLHGIDFRDSKSTFRGENPSLKINWSHLKEDLEYIYKKPLKGQNNTTGVRSYLTKRIQSLIRNH